MTTREAARIINAIKCSMVTSVEEHEALTMAEWVLCEQDIKTASVDAPIKHGRWIKVDGHTVKCSECGNYLDMRGVNAGRGDANYCPHCGAKMDDQEAKP